MNLFRLAQCLLVLLLGLGAVSLKYVDYGYLFWVARQKAAGRTVSSCLDLPEKYWRRIPVCNGVVQE